MEEIIDLAKTKLTDCKNELIIRVAKAEDLVKILNNMRNKLFNRYRRKKNDDILIDTDRIQNSILDLEDKLDLAIRYLDYLSDVIKEDISSLLHNITYIHGDCVYHITILNKSIKRVEKEFGF